MRMKLQESSKFNWKGIVNWNENRKDGGNIFFNRVQGLLAVTRAFGDHILKDKVIFIIEILGGMRSIMEKIPMEGRWKKLWIRIFLGRILEREFLNFSKK